MMGRPPPGRRSQFAPVSGFPALARGVLLEGLFVHPPRRGQVRALLQGRARHRLGPPGLHLVEGYALFEEFRGVPPLPVVFMLPPDVDAEVSAERIDLVIVHEGDVEDVTRSDLAV